MLPRLANFHHTVCRQYLISTGTDQVRSAASCHQTAGTM